MVWMCVCVDDDGKSVGRALEKGGFPSGVLKRSAILHHREWSGQELGVFRWCVYVCIRSSLRGVEAFRWSGGRRRGLRDIYRLRPLSIFCFFVRGSKIVHIARQLSLYLFFFPSSFTLHFAFSFSSQSTFVLPFHSSLILHPSPSFSPLAFTPPHITTVRPSSMTSLPK